MNEKLWDIYTMEYYTTSNDKKLQVRHHGFNSQHHKTEKKPGVVEHVCDPSAWEVDSEKSQTQG
jgi:hypothetical protein